MAGEATAKKAFGMKEPKDLSPRAKWLRDYYFEGVDRAWNNEFTAWTTGTEHDVIWDEMTYYIVPEVYPFMQTFVGSFTQTARQVPLPSGFWEMSLPERRAFFIKEVMVRCLPAEVLPHDLLCGARFNIQASRCFDKAEAKERSRLVSGRGGARSQMKWFHDHGYGNAGATSGHLIPDYPRIINRGFAEIHEDLLTRYKALSAEDKKGDKGAELRAMMIAATMPRDLAGRYADRCRELAQAEAEGPRREELLRMAGNLDRVPWLPAEDFFQAVQSLWLTHMLVMSDENYPGPGVSFGRVDQYLLPYWEKSLAGGEDREFLKEIIRCFFFHANTAYDAMIRTGGNQGITSGYGQLITLSGMGPDGRDMTNDLTFAFLEVIDEMSPILEPKPNVRLHKGSPDALLEKVVEMAGECQGAPFLLNFDERSMAGMMREAEMAGVYDLINEKNVCEYSPVGCLENTMCGNDRSGTVDININLAKALELALGNGKSLANYRDPIMGKVYPIIQEGPQTGVAESFETFDRFYAAFETQVRYLIGKAMQVYEASEQVRVRFCPTPYLSCLVRGCAEKAMDVTRGAAELSFVTIEAVTFATTVDSLLAVKHLVFDTRSCTMAELKKALLDNWQGHDVLAAKARFKAPKFGRDDDAADELAAKVMELWTAETWKHRTVSSNRQARPGMLSWNYWIADGYILPATPDGRQKGSFLSNAICPVNGADINGPTANVNSVGKALAGISRRKQGDFQGIANCLPNGASHTITFSPSLLRDPEHKEKFKAFLRGYIQNGGTALQVNMLDADMLKDAQKNPTDYRHLLVRVTGYNAYFTAIGKELQDEVIARISHNKL
ncbi:MAG: pyruvate formate lyase family protein [Thermodesulfobacteriota bacterium]